MEKLDRIVIREYQSTDKNMLHEIARKCFEEDILPVIDQPNTLFDYTALHENQVIGTMFAWKSEFHSNCIYFRIFIDPSFRVENIEKELLDVLIEHAEKQKVDYLPLQTSLWETSIGLKKLYKKYGFKELRRTYMPVLQVEDALVSTPVALDSNIRTIEEISQDQKLKSKLVELVRRNYMETHMDNPVLENIEIAVWEQLVFAEDVIADGSFVYIDEYTEEIIAYSFMHLSDTVDTFELGWCGASPDESQENILSLVDCQIAYAHKQGVQKLMGEFDTTDEAAMGVLASFPFAPCPTWVTYSLNLQ